MNVTCTVNSNQVPLRHTRVLIYRCFLPDLTGFISSHCAGPNSPRHLYRAVFTIRCRRQEFNPAIADCRLQGTATSPSSTAKFYKLLKWRREWDSNPRGLSALHAFQACPLPTRSSLLKKLNI